MRPMLLVLVVAVGLSLSTAAGASAPVHVIPVSGTIDAVVARFLDRSLTAAEQSGAPLVVLEISTLGGAVDAALQIRDRIISARVPVVGFVTQRAWSAGALIAMACEELVMTPGSSLGAAEPRPDDEKTISALRAEFESTAEATGRDPRLAAAMVDKSLQIEDLVGSGELLTLTYRQALDLGFSDRTASTREEVLAGWDLAGAPVLVAQQRQAERLARYVVNPTVSAVLLSLGMLGLVAEITSPGFGVPGIGGLTCLGAFFGGHLLAGFAGWEVVALFVVGLVLLMVEVFVPGFGVFGIGGVAAIIFSIVLASSSTQQAVTSLVIAMVVSIATIIIMVRVLGRRGFWSRLTLGTTLSEKDGYVPVASRQELVGKLGVALTPLRPSGSAQIGDTRVDVVTDGEFIALGQHVVVRRLEGMRVVVGVAPSGQSPDAPTEGGS